MKKVLFAVLILTLGITGLAHAVCNPRIQTCMKSIHVSSHTTLAGTLTVEAPTTFHNTAKLYSRTLAQINALTPSQAGLMVLCSDCTRSAVCVSSGTTTGAWVIVAATGTFSGSTFSGIQHCQ